MRRAKQVREIERQSRHIEFHGTPGPNLSLTVGVDLDLYAIRVSEVEDFADKVIAACRMDPAPVKALCKARERGPRRR